MDANLRKKTLDYLENICARREYCRHDIFQKALKRLDGDRESAEELTEELVAGNFVNELRYASAFAREKSSIGGWGAIKIRFALRSKGIDDRIIAAALEEIDTDKSTDKLRRLMENKHKTLAGDPQAKLKLIRFALSRGYDYDRIKDMIEDILYIK